MADLNARGCSLRLVRNGLDVGTHRREFVDEKVSFLGIARPVQLHERDAELFPLHKRFSVGEL